MLLHIVTQVYHILMAYFCHIYKKQNGINANRKTNLLKTCHMPFEKVFSIFRFLETFVGSVLSHFVSKTLEAKLTHFISCFPQ